MGKTAGACAMTDVSSFGECVWRNEYLRGLILCFRKRWTANEAAGRGLVAVFVNFGHRLPGYSRATLNHALVGGHLEVVKWLWMNRPDTRSVDVTDRAAKRGHLHILKWFHTECNVTPSRVAFQASSRTENVHVLRWILRTFKVKEALVHETMTWTRGLDVVYVLHN